MAFGGEIKKAYLRGVNWLSWEKITMKKEFGGMGFQNLHGFKISIVTKVLKVKYFPSGEFS